jgi:hypothetical protein
MTRFAFILWGLAIFALGALFMAVFLIHPAFAVEPPSVICYTQGELENDVRDHGNKIVGGASYDGAITDSFVTVQTGTDILVYGFRDGCYIGLTELEPVAKPRPDGAA